MVSSGEPRQGGGGGARVAMLGGPRQGRAIKGNGDRAEACKQGGVIIVQDLIGRNAVARVVEVHLAIELAHENSDGVMQGCVATVKDRLEKLNVDGRIHLDGEFDFKREFTGRNRRMTGNINGVVQGDALA